MRSSPRYADSAASRRNRVDRLHYLAGAVLPGLQQEKGTFYFLLASGEKVECPLFPPNPIDLSDPQSLWNFITQPEQPNGAGGLGLDVESLIDEITSGLLNEAAQELPRVAAQVAAKFVPGFGTLNLIISTGSWMLSNAQELQTHLASLFSLSKADFEMDTGAKVREKVAAALPGMANLGLDFMARQFGLDRIKKLFREKIADLPGKIEDKLKAFVTSKTTGPLLRTGSPGTGTGNVYTGQVGQRYEFNYLSNNYKLIVARLTGKKSVANSDPDVSRT